jgi:hypothetical protein
MEIFAAYDWKPFQSCFKLFLTSGQNFWALLNNSLKVHNEIVLGLTTSTPKVPTFSK